MLRPIDGYTTTQRLQPFVQSIVTIKEGKFCFSGKGGG